MYVSYTRRYLSWNTMIPIILCQCAHRTKQKYKNYTRVLPTALLQCYYYVNVRISLQLYPRLIVLSECYTILVVNVKIYYGRLRKYGTRT